MNILKRNLSCLAVMASFVACDQPTIEEYEPRSGIIQGTVLYRPAPAEPTNPCVAEPRTGNVIITLFEADRLPPPQGSSGPVNFVVIPEAQLFGGDPTDGVYATQYTLPTVAAGRYQVRAFLDADQDFHPTIDFLNQVTAGDIGGGHVDPTTGDFLEIEVENDRITTPVTVSLGLAIPTERPSFRFATTSTGGPSVDLPLTGAQTVVLQSEPITGSTIEHKPECTAFLVQYADVDNDGEIDDVNGDHLLDVFPQVIFRHRASAAAGRNILIPGVVNPLPYQDVLSAQGAALTTSLSVILPPVSVEVMPSGERVVSREIPTGPYDTIVISGTGQTWQLPNNLGVVASEIQLASQQAELTINPGPDLPAGRVQGILRSAIGEASDAFVFAFAADNPPPPAGTGRPVAVGTIAAAAFGNAGTALEAPFELVGLAPGPYILAGLVDVDSDFAALVPLLAQASAGDRTGTAAVTVPDGLVDGVLIEVNTEVPVDRPVFELVSSTEVARTALPGAISLSILNTDISAFMQAGLLLQQKQPAEDIEGDNFADVFPRVLLTHIVDDGPPETAPSHPDGAIIPGVVDTLPYEVGFANGQSIQPLPAMETLRIILPPVAVTADGTPIGLPPAGRYRVNVIANTGQTWSVPNDINIQLGRAGTALEIAGQSAFVEITDPGTPAGLVQGSIQLESAPAGDFQVVVVAVDAATAGSPFPTSPLATAVVGKAAFGAGTTAPYRLGPLPAGNFVVRAFLDANDNFTPWFDTLNQPDQGDVGGGVLDQNGLVAVTVDPNAGPTAADVAIVNAQTLPFDRPGFTMSGAVLSRSQGPATVSLQSLVAAGPVLQQASTFVVQWVDVNRDGSADDVNGDGQPDVYPLVVAQLLDEENPEQLDARGLRIPGIVPPNQFGGFPAQDPTQTQVVVTTSSVQVAFPPIAVDANGTQSPPPDGLYRVTVINPFGQTWTLPNELSRVTGSPLQSSQSEALRVQE